MPAAQQEVRPNSVQHALTVKLAINQIQLTIGKLIHVADQAARE